MSLVGELSRSAVHLPDARGGATNNAFDKQRGVEEDEPGVDPHSAAFSVQSRSSWGGKYRDVNITGGGVHWASTPGDQGSAAMLTQSWNYTSADTTGNFILNIIAAVRSTNLTSDV